MTSLGLFVTARRLRPESSEGAGRNVQTTWRCGTRSAARVLVELLGCYSKNPDQGKRLLLLTDLPRGRATSSPRAARQRQRRLREPEAAELVASYQNGATLKQLAQRFEVHHQTVAAILKRAGVPRRHQRLSHAQIVEAAGLYASGLSFARLGERYEVDASTVRYAFLRAGYQLGGHTREL